MVMLRNGACYWKGLSLSFKSSQVISALIFFSFCSWLKCRQWIVCGLLCLSFFNVILFIFKTRPIWGSNADCLTFFVIQKKVALLRWAQGVCLCHAAARKKPCTGAAAPTWWHSCRSPGRTAQGAPACWEGGKDRELCVHMCWLLGNTFFGAFQMFSLCLYMSLLFPCPLFVYSPSQPTSLPVGTLLESTVFSEKLVILN